ncbi:sulfurtransferase TusD [Candidatus Williamhamiltonella defendens]|uniref:Sulfurtransferase TusD n=3 Tax=Candidatus Williamhamiltonella defendens TaxID=138072 RepID=A0A249DXI9_9ENTR|nr:sulfurtransferase complex subunit TusD [Candidatus Hamiltonella defensa]ACQ66853.1 tRNA 2-thiouridine synthesizing sulfurtransferase D [Candidatus Hamiltonella defensa 5AT (Acyrthosiphon pisum)]ASV32843.1 sulfurtransferase TusD [Candidatus Hamiltonella defensa]ASX26248.1 tRNA 2-thiouridine(34) synthase TusD [Candidatus Hamiltonella defensa (Bemisia tabaci)]ATW21661.1 sulfurtransferase TusD [Candidatus Hamiltonella defensa]ATW29048.1 sulfurtransferase TusD [Candidatus Hamiltonella defensa]
MKKLSYCLLVTGPPYGTEQASSAYQFAKALLDTKHRLISIFFYQDGVFNANRFVTPASDEFDLVRAWHQLALDHHIMLNVCISAASRRGVGCLQQEQIQSYSSSYNLQNGFTLSGLTALVEALLTCDRVIQF